MTVTFEELDHIAERYHLNTEIQDMHIENTCQKYFVDWLLRQINESDKILELGYGDGVITEALLRNGYNITVLEGAASLVSKAKQILPSLHCIHGLFEEYSAQSQYDIILASHVLEHLDNPVELLCRMSAWIKPQGRLIVVVPNQSSLHRQLAVIMGLQPQLDTLSKRDIVVGHKRVYSFESLEHDLHCASYNVLDRAGFFLKPLPNSMMLEYSTQLLNALNEISPQLPRHLLANIAVVATPA